MQVFHYVHKFTARFSQNKFYLFGPWSPVVCSRNTLLPWFSKTLSVGFPQYICMLCISVRLSDQKLDWWKMSQGLHSCYGLSLIHLATFDKKTPQVQLLKWNYFVVLVVLGGKCQWTRLRKEEGRYFSMSELSDHKVSLRSSCGHWACWCSSHICKTFTMVFLQPTAR